MHALDNVIWQALTTRQAHFAEGSRHARRFVPDVSPLAAFRGNDIEGYAALADLLAPRTSVGLFLDQAYEPRDGWTFVAGAPLLQMICEKREDGGEFAPIPQIEELGVTDSPEMIELTTLTKPGPFGSRTHEFGTYLGIHSEGKLVAMAGERLRVPGHTEVSAVCTHPDHAGRGYARVLMAEIMRHIQDRGEVPFLHVRGDNARAVELYRRLGFRIRKEMHFAVLRKI